MTTTDRPANDVQGAMTPGEQWAIDRYVAAKEEATRLLYKLKIAQSLLVEWQMRADAAERIAASVSKRATKRQWRYFVNVCREYGVDPLRFAEQQTGKTPVELLRSDMGPLIEKLQTMRDDTTRED